MVQKILRTMQDDLKALKERQQPERDSVKNEELPAQSKNSLQQTDTSQNAPRMPETKQEAPALTGLGSLGLSNSIPNRTDHDEIRRIREELENNPANLASANATDREELQRKKEEAMEKQREKIKEAEKQRLEEEKKRLMQEEQQRQIEEERKKIEEAAQLQAEKAGRKAQEQKREETGKNEEGEDRRGIEKEMARITELKKRERNLDELKKLREKIAQEEEAEKKIEEERKVREEEEMRKMEELRKKEEDLKKAEAETERYEKELAKKEEEEIRKVEEEANRVEREAKQIEDELAKKEEELQKMEKKEKERIEELVRNKEEMAEAEKELERKEDELEKKEEELKRREELRRKMREEILGEEFPAKEEKGSGAGQISHDGKNTIYEDGQDRQNLQKLREYGNSPISEEIYAAPGKEAYMEALEKKPDMHIGEPEEGAADKELASLARRVSSAMNTTVKQEENDAASDIVQSPDKDKDIKELIARMSRNLEREKEALEKEQQQAFAQQNPVPAREETEYGNRDSEIGFEPKSAPAFEPLTAAPDFEGKQFGKEPEISAIPSQTPLAQTAAATETGMPQGEDRAGSYWASLHDTLKKTPDMSKAAMTAYPTPEETGLIVPKKSPQDLEEEKGPSLPFKHRLGKSHISDYVDPENRLIFGKQEFYSSMHKKVKPKTWEANLDDLKETVKEDEIKLSDEEEKKKLRHQIITKYKIELFSMPWAKIVVFSFLFLATLGITLYVFIPKFVPKEAAKEEIITGESIAEIDNLIPQKIVARQKEVSTLNYFDSEIEPWKSLADGSITRLVINNDSHEIMLTRDEALKAILGTDNFNNMPKDALGFLDNEYNILAFKNNDVLRLGIALKYDRNKEEKFKESMANWAGTPSKAQKIHNVMKALFVNSKVEEKSSTAFQPSSYNNVNIYYLNLPDTDTSMDYFIYKGYLVFTTSKNTTSEMIDLLQQ